MTLPVPKLHASNENYVPQRMVEFLDRMDNVSRETGDMFHDVPAAGNTRRLCLMPSRPLRQLDSISFFSIRDLLSPSSARVAFKRPTLPIGRSSVSFTQLPSAGVPGRSLKSCGLQFVRWVQQLYALQRGTCIVQMSSLYF
jgi:hypothetical protein